MRAPSIISGYVVCERCGRLVNQDDAEPQERAEDGHWCYVCQRCGCAASKQRRLGDARPMLGERVRGERQA